MSSIFIVSLCFLGHSYIFLYVTQTEAGRGLQGLNMRVSLVGPCNPVSLEVLMCKKHNLESVLRPLTSRDQMKWRPSPFPSTTYLRYVCGAYHGPVHKGIQAVTQGCWPEQEYGFLVRICAFTALCTVHLKSNSIKAKILILNLHRT